MAWKKKEKLISREEAVAAAKKEFAPYWVGSEPLVAGVVTPEGGVSVHPLDLTFEKSAWIFILVDLTTFSGESALDIARDWHRRYSGYSVNFVLITRSTYKFLDTIATFQPMFKKHGLIFPAVLDHEGLLYRAFNASPAIPKVVLHAKGKIIFEKVGPQWFEGAESLLQHYLRESDPGLPFNLPFEGTHELPADQLRVELGRSTRPKGLAFGGKWTQEQDCIVARDGTAVMRFKSPSARISFVAERLSTEDRRSRIKIEANRDSAFEAISGADLTMAEDGSSELKVAGPMIYHALVNLPERLREITLKFPDAERFPVALYGIRLGS
ncbi:hypothetical protein WDW37_05280 [Bdellovibrionota bacterium FG-1]